MTDNEAGESESGVDRDGEKSRACDKTEIVCKDADGERDNRGKDDERVCGSKGEET